MFNESNVLFNHFIRYNFDCLSSKIRDHLFLIFHCLQRLIFSKAHTHCAEEVPQEGQTDSRFSIKCRWYRSIVTKTGHVCWVHPERDAAIQCILCLRTKVDTKRSYHCGPECLREHWNFHVDFHSQVRDNNASSNGYGSSADLRSASYTYSNSGEAWVEISKNRVYVPTADDVGCILKFECTAHDVASAYPDIGKTFSIITMRVRPAPAPPRRVMVPFTPSKPTVSRGKFTVLSYNLLADLYASPEQFNYCPSWALSWPYRRTNLLKELLSYDADILCLQEVQSNHFTDFLAPELSAVGYTAIYKKKTTEMYTRNAYAIDGCAIFFRRDRFTLVKKYEVEFNKAALSLAESLPPEQKKAALNRLLKDNVALIAVVEALDPPFADDKKKGGSTSGSMDGTTNNNPSTASTGSAGGSIGEDGTTAAASNPSSSSSRRQLLCIANTHIHSNPELNDVKLWQVHTLLKGLEKIAASADIPMLVAGDFNTMPGSAAHALLVNGAVPPLSPELLNDPLSILKPPAKLSHRLPLSSSYATAATADVVPSGEASHAALRQRRRLDGGTGEPKFTNFTRDFKGTLDYIFYTKDSLVPVATLELPDESEVRTKSGVGMPNDVWSSDHVALMAEFEYQARSGAEAPGTPSGG